MNRDISRKAALSGLLIAIAVVFGTFSIPIFGAKMSPVQHFINVVSAVLLGPGYAVGNAFIEQNKGYNVISSSNFLSPASRCITTPSFKWLNPSINASAKLLDTGISGTL